ncbi:porin [Vibrio astriarenae]|uniref:porin n=1 Tax=Vibrio astriarenae TaxID=1481923 RepID=UPI00373556AE
MKIKLLTLAVATTFGAPSFAVQVYEDNSSTFSIGGYVDVGVGEYGDSTEVEVHQVSPRLNIEGTHDIGNGVTVDAKGEWAINYLEGGDNSFTTRLGYIGATHETAGRLVVGTQWTPYYDILGVADQPIAFANDFLYANQGNLGGARGDKMVTYRNGFSFGNDMSLDFGLGWQGQKTDDAVDYDDRGQISVAFSALGATLGYVFNGGEVDSEDAESHGVALSYGKYADGIFGALVYADNDNFYSNYYESQQYEAIIAYGLTTGTVFSVNYEFVEGKVAPGASKTTDFEQSAIQVEHAFTQRFVGFAGYQFDIEDDDDKWSIGGRFFL